MNIEPDDLIDFPIQFKEINYSDFPNYLPSDEEKIIITPNAEGYISDELYNEIDLDRKDTTIINAGVGQGKTKAIIDFIKYYYGRNEDKTGNYKIVIVTPFKALNSEYSRKIYNAIGQEDLCFDYQEINTPSGQNFDVNFAKPIQLISVKSILGDPGQEALQQNSQKRLYYEYIIEQCDLRKMQVIMFFDELHESLESFKEQYLPNLFKWQSVIHKIIVASATFTESSILPLKYFAVLTDNQVKILESKRVSSPNISDLSIIFYNRPNYDANDHFLKSIFDELIDNNDYNTLNVLCASEAWATTLYESAIGEKIKSKYPDLNLCVGASDQVFEQENSNIGTTFKTGISIEKENSCFVMFLPSSFANNKNRLGVFTDRINSLTQAIARPRVKSQIIVICPPPSNLIIRDDDSTDYQDMISLGYLSFRNLKYHVPFYSYDQQKDFLEKQYQKIREDIEDEISVLQSLNGSLALNFDSFDWFRLKRGDRYLNENFESYGKTLANYFYWAAWNNQFVNCRLTKITSKFTMFFEEGKIQECLDKYVPLSFLNTQSFVDFSDSRIYDDLKRFIYSANVFLVPKEMNEDLTPQKPTIITPSKNPSFKQQIIHFLQRRKTPYLFEPAYGCSYSTLNNDKPIDGNLNKEKYLRTAISQCLNVIEKADFLKPNELRLVSAYNDLFTFKSILKAEYSTQNSSGDMLLPLDSKMKFKNMHLIRLINIFEILIRDDVGLDVFNLKEIPEEKSIYSLLKKVFFRLSITTFKGEKWSKIYSEYSFEYSDYKLNLVYNVHEPFLYTPFPPSQIEVSNNDELDLEDNGDETLKIIFNDESPEVTELE